MCPLEDNKFTCILYHARSCRECAIGGPDGWTYVHKWPAYTNSIQKLTPPEMKFYLFQPMFFHQDAMTNWNSFIRFHDSFMEIYDVLVSVNYLVITRWCIEGHKLPLGQNANFLFLLFLIHWATRFKIEIELSCIEILICFAFLILFY